LLALLSSSKRAGVSKVNKVLAENKQGSKESSMIIAMLDNPVTEKPVFSLVVFCKDMTEMIMKMSVINL